MSKLFQTIIGILIFLVFIYAVIQITNERNRESSYPNADCETSIWP
jgi:predicted permease